MEAAEVTEMLIDIILARHGLPHQILSDQGTQFAGSLMQGLCKHLGIQSITTSPFHPQANRSVECFHGTLIPMLRKAIPLELPLRLFAIRSSPNRSTGYSPFELLLGQNVRSPVDLIKEEVEWDNKEPVKVREWLEGMNSRLDVIWDDARMRGLYERDVRKEAYDRGMTSNQYKKGEMVLLHMPGMHGKLEDAWEGPYEILQQLNSVNVRLGMPPN